MSFRTWLKSANAHMRWYQDVPVELTDKSRIGLKPGLLIAVATCAVGAGLTIAKDRRRAPPSMTGLPHERGTY